MANGDDPRKLDPVAKAILVGACSKLTEVLGGRAKAALVVVLVDEGMTMLGTTLSEEVAQDNEVAGQALATLAVAGRNHIERLVAQLAAGGGGFVAVDLDEQKKGGS